MRGALARFLFVVLACLAGAGAGSDLIVATAAAESSGDWQISAKVDDVAKTKVLNVKSKRGKPHMTGYSFRPMRCSSSSASRTNP